MVSKFYFRPAAGEHIETVVPMEPESYAAVCGRVTDARSRPLPEVLLLLYTAGEEPRLLGRTVTDEEGQFAFGPLEAEKLYLIKVFKNNVKLRELEISTG